jgi:hypothetical protein
MAHAMSQLFFKGSRTHACGECLLMCQVTMRCLVNNLRG